jgi:hypothetical protein
MEYATEEYVRSMFPPMSQEEASFMSNLPEKVELEVPFVYQEEKHWSGAAVVQMLHQYFGDPVESQRNLVATNSWNDWKEFDHSTFREKMASCMIKRNYLYSLYFPAKYIGPKIKDPIEASDFIRRNDQVIQKIDHEYMRGLLAATKVPLIVRLHFNEYDYPMNEEMIQRLDVSGHCVLFVGYDREGFIIHDPWNKNDWGGKRGGPYCKIRYEDMFEGNPRPVNQTYDYSGCANKLIVSIPPPKEIVFQERVITVRCKVEWPGMTGILGDFIKLSDINAKLTLSDNFSCLSDPNQKLDELIPGQKSFLEWKVNVGKMEGSFPVNVQVTCKITMPAVSWEKNSRGLITYLTAHGHTRIGVFEKEAVIKFASQEYNVNTIEVKQ